MSEEIDLQAYIAAVRRRWWVVLLVIALALAASLVFSAIQPKSYQATVTLLAQPPRYQWNFGAGVADLIDVRRDYQREFLAISRSNRIAQQAAADLQAGDLSPNDLLAIVNVRQGEGNTLLVAATAGDPQRAAAIANAWASAFIGLVNELYGVDADLARFQEELALASQRLEELDDQMIAVRTSTGLYAAGDSLDQAEAFSVQQRQLTLQGQRLAEYRLDLESLRYLQTRLVEAGPETDLALLPWELLDGPVLSQRGLLTPEIARATLNDPGALLALLRQESEALATTAQQLADEVEQLQAAVAVDWRTYGRVNRLRSQVQETENRLTRKVEEATLQKRIDPGLLVLVSEAIPPAAPLQTRRLAQLAVAGVIGLILGVLAVLWLDARLGRPETAL